MPLDPQVRPLLDALGSDLDLETLAPDVFRKLFRQLTGTRGGPDLSRVEDRSVPGPGGDVRVRLYADAAPGPLPTVAYFHGGGFVVGDLDTHDTQCRHLAREAGCAVVAVDYRLRQKNGWKIYDIKIDGISLVKNFRSSFDAEIKQHGVEGLIATLREKNAALAGR